MELLIRPLQSDADAAAFRVLNEEWIERHFSLEDDERRQLTDPVSAFIRPGAAIEHARGLGAR